MAYRTPEQIDAIKATLQKQGEQQKSQQASIQTLPPGFMEGFRMVLQPDGNVEVDPGIINVAGMRVEKQTTYQLREEDELVERLGGGWRYLYITKDGLFKVDVLAPVFNTGFQSYYAPRSPWRFIGRMWIGSDKYYKYAYRGIYGSR